MKIEIDNKRARLLRINDFRIRRVAFDRFDAVFHCRSGRISFAASEWFAVTGFQNEKCFVVFRCFAVITVVIRRIFTHRFNPFLRACPRFVSFAGQNGLPVRRFQIKAKLAAAAFFDFKFSRNLFLSKNYIYLNKLWLINITNRAQR